MSRRRMRPSARCGSGPRATTCRSCRGAQASGPLTKSSRGSALVPGPRSPPPGTEPMADYAPFHVARTFATLDHLSGGRAAWNVVTSVNDSEAQNYGFDQTLGHDERYDRADEFLEATTGLWDTWEDEALVLDRARGVFADPDKVHELNHDGKWFRVRGPLTVPRAPQGRPVLLQAGSSGRGRDFAARRAELICTGDPDIDIARAHYKDQKERIALLGRDPQM